MPSRIAVVFVGFCVGSGLREGLITDSEVFCRVCVRACVIVCSTKLDNEESKAKLGC